MMHPKNEIEKEEEERNGLYQLTGILSLGLPGLCRTCNM